MRSASMIAPSSQRSPLWWALVATCALLLLAQMVVSSVLFLGDKGSAVLAQGSGQRLWLSPSLVTQPTLEPSSPPPIVQEATPVTAPEPTQNEFTASEEETAEAEAAAPPEEEVAAIAEPASDASFTASDQEVLDAIPAEPRTAASLAAPLDALLETSENGALPLRDGTLTAFETYRKPFTPPAPAKPMIALVVSDLGSMRATTEAATQLPANVTLAFNPYARHSASWLQTARNKGIESWLMLPAQPDSFPAGDAGSQALLVDQPVEETLKKLKFVMASAQGYSGLILPAGEAYSDHLESLGWLNQQMESRGLAMIAAERPSNSAAAGWFKKQKDAYAAEVLIDASLSHEAITKQLAALETQANQQGAAMGVIRPYPLSLALVTPWLKSLEQKGFVLAPASAMFKRSAP